MYPQAAIVAAGDVLNAVWGHHTLAPEAVILMPTGASLGAFCVMCPKLHEMTFMRLR